MFWLSFTSLFYTHRGEGEMGLVMLNLGGIHVKVYVVVVRVCAGRYEEGKEVGPMSVVIFFFTHLKRKLTSLTRPAFTKKEVEKRGDIIKLAVHVCRWVEGCVCVRVAMSPNVLRNSWLLSFD